MILVDMEHLSEIIEQVLCENSNVRLTVTGNSMYPLFRHGTDSVVLGIKPKIRKYDIPLYKRDNGEYVLHRVVKKKDDFLYTCGDNQTVIEYPVMPAQVLACVVGFYRKDKYISCSNLIYKLYSRLWVLVLPLRFEIIKISAFIRRKLSGK